jgi:hydroxyacylglutathione hydrolase
MNLIALPALTDNYIWILHDGQRAIVVDPGDAAPVLGALTSMKLALMGILVTHHHPDHVAGLKGLRSVLQGPIFGPADEVVPVAYTPVSEGNRLDLLDMGWTVLDVPGHTSGHVAYVSDVPGLVDEGPILFCGDTLFSAGCGRLFEGTPSQMHHSLQRLAQLPGNTRVCCAHEYTLANLEFARAVEPQNSAAEAHRKWSLAQRALKLPTLPTTIACELAINPFLRCSEPDVIERALQHGAVSNESLDVFTALRLWKNRF